MVAGAATIGGVLGYGIGEYHRWHTSEPSFISPSAEPIVNRALDIYGHGKVSREGLRRSYDINVVYLPTMTCVGFNLLPQTLGGGDTMCLDKSGQRVVQWYHNGE